MTSGRLARWTRFAVIAAIPLVGATLLAMVWTTRSAIRSASNTVNRGEAETLHGAVWARLMQPDERPLEARLREVLLDHEADGLRYIAALDRDGSMLGEAGEPTLDADALRAWKEAATVAVPVKVGDRMRAWWGRPPKKPGDPNPRAGDDTPPGGTRPDGTRRAPFSVLVLEMTPKVAPELESTGRWLFGTGVIAALTLSLLAGVFVRWSVRREAAVRQVEQARHLATLGQMSAVLAHEIRNPLASLKGNAQLLAASLPAGDKPRAKADRVVDEAVRLESLTNDLLEFARTGELHLAEVDPGGLVRDAAASVDAARIVVDDAGAPRTWRLDPDRIRQVLVNLLENGVAMGDGPVHVTVARDESQLLLTVRDSGPGIPDADLPHLFEPFFTRRTRGTGLGLAVAKRFVELHGGTIRAGNASGGGAELHIALPRREGTWRAS